MAIELHLQSHQQHVCKAIASRVDVKSPIHVVLILQLSDISCSIHSHFGAKQTDRAPDSGAYFLAQTERLE